MIDVTKMKSVKELMEIHDDLNFFIDNKTVGDIYAEQEMDADELEEDRQLARQLLENVIRRLSRLNQPVKKPDSKPHQRGTLA